MGPLVLEAKEGLSLVNGTPCVTGLTALALKRSEQLLDWADLIGAMSFENLHGQLSAFDTGGVAAAPLAGAHAGRGAICDQRSRAAPSWRRAPGGVRRIP